MTSMTIKNINTVVTTFFIERGELPSSEGATKTLHCDVERALPEEINFELFDEIMYDFVKAFGPVMDSLIHNMDQLEDEDKTNCERAVKAMWNGDADTQERLSKLFKKKVSKKPEIKSKAKKNDPKKFFKKIGPDLRKALREMKKKKAISPRIIFRKKVSPELKKAVKEFKKKKIVDKKAEREAKKAEREAKKAEREAKKAEKETDVDKTDTIVSNEESDKNDSDEESSSADEEEALRRIKTARPDLTDDGARILLEKFKSKLSQ